MSAYGSRSIAELLARAKVCGAPIGPLENTSSGRWHQSPMGQTYAPPKVLKDLRTGRRISIAQARQIVTRYE